MSSVDRARFLWYTAGMTKITADCELPTDFARRMQALLTPEDYAAYLNALAEPPKRFARKNPLKPAPDDLIAAELGGYPLLPPAAKPGAGALHAAGAYYVQEPAAAAVANLLAPLLPPRATVLDMCAAPGGKATAVAAALPEAHVLANEIVFSRAKILLSNIERLGLRNCTVTSLTPDAVAVRGAGLFDAVIADVPCSGEGMLRKTDFFASDLSDESVLSCAARAARIVDACDLCLREGGILLFSTCTFNRAENEEQVLRLVREKGYEPIDVPRPPHARAGYGLSQAIRFFPQDGGGEGHFACVLRKCAKPAGETQNEMHARRREKTSKPAGGALLRQTQDTLSAITREAFAAERMRIAGEGVEYVLPADPFAAFPALRRGMRLADFVNGRVLPHHHFATAARANELLHAPDYPPDSAEIAAYLSGNAFPCREKSGFRVVKVAAVPLGLIKISDGIAKNHYPKGLRK